MELKECTFFPNKNSKTLSKLDINEEELGKEIYQRNLNWEQQKLQKIKEEQERKKELEVQECSFAPLLTQPHHLGSVGLMSTRFRQARKSNMTDLENYQSKASHLGIAD